VNSSSFLLSLFMLLYPLTLTLPTANEPSADQKFKAGNLFIIVANGLRYDDALGNKNHLYTENIWNTLRPAGTICSHFYNTKLTYPVPALASLLTGVWQVNKTPLCDTMRPTGRWWTVTEYDTSRAWRYNLRYESANLNREYYLKGCGFSIRLVKEYGKPFLPCKQ
jgi:hypothetical protein